MEQARESRFPERLIEMVNKLVRTSQRMLTEIGRKPTVEELAERLAMPVDRVRRLRNIAKGQI
jgi:RNA polymerase primary sigma factor